MNFITKSILLSLGLLSVNAFADETIQVENNKELKIKTEETVSKIEETSLDVIAEKNEEKVYPVIKRNTPVVELILEDNKNIRALYKKNPEMFKTSERIEADLEVEKMIASKFKELYFDQKDSYDSNEYNKMMNGYFVDALKAGHRNLADDIFYNSGAEIDLNYMSDSPKNTPLMAVATSFAYDGGDIEYFIKLIKMGADFTYLTETNKVSLMSLAASVDNYKIVFYLAMIGENPMHLDGFDYYPLDYAQKNDSHMSTLILTQIIKEYKKQIELRSRRN